VQLGYALTVHKAQGSEFPVVLVVVHDSHAYAHHRNWLYTAVTRGREGVVLLGSRRSLRMCARIERQDTRRTLLGERLRAERVIVPTS
jgi:exodeoxyribonuclease V alpha subunit